MEKIQIMFKDYMEFRREYGVDDILTRYKFTKREEL